LRVCPGWWYPPQSDYLRRAGEFFGLVGSQSSDRISLLPPDKPPVGASNVDVPVPEPARIAPDEVFVRACAPAFGALDRLLDRGDNLRQALAESANIMDQLKREARSAPELVANALAPINRVVPDAEQFETWVREYRASDGPCHAGAPGLAAETPRNVPCVERSQWGDVAVQRADSIAVAFREYGHILAELSANRLPIIDAIAGSERPLATATEQSKQFDSARSEYQARAEHCATLT
jgi:hypothetical protein